MAHMQISSDIRGWYYNRKIFFLVLFWFKKIIFFPIIIYLFFYSVVVIIWILHFIQTYNKTIESKELNQTILFIKLATWRNGYAEDCKSWPLYDLTVIIALFYKPNFFWDRVQALYGQLLVNFQPPLVKAKPFDFGEFFRRYLLVFGLKFLHYLSFKVVCISFSLLVLHHTILRSSFFIYPSSSFGMLG